MPTSSQVDILRPQDGKGSSQPRLHQHGIEVQRFGAMRLLPIALLVHEPCEHATSPRLACEHCGGDVTPDTVRPEPS